LIENTEVLIIGGGVSGLSIGYFLAKEGMDVTVIEKSYLGHGSSGRCGGGVREQFATPESIYLSKKSIDFFEKMSAIMNYNILFRQGGYLFLAYDEKSLESMKKNVEIQNRYGVKSRIMMPDEIKERYPYIDTSKIYGGAYNHRDGIVFPQAVVEAYAKGFQKYGGKIYTFTNAYNFKMNNGKIESVLTDKGEIKAKIFVGAAGAYTREVAKWAGVNIPTRPVRHEIIATEPIKFFQEPMLVGIPSGIYFSQSMRGEIVGGIGDPVEFEGYNINTTVDFLKHFSREITNMIPSVKYVKIMRQWAGLYDMSPDVKPILSGTGVENFYVACGYSGHGLMISPMVGRLMSQLILGHPTDLDMKSFSLERFKEGKLEIETTKIG